MEKTSLAYTKTFRASLGGDYAFLDHLDRLVIENKINNKTRNTIFNILGRYNHDLAQLLPIKDPSLYRTIILYLRNQYLDLIQSKTYSKEEEIEKSARHTMNNYVVARYRDLMRASIKQQRIKEKR